MYPLVQVAELYEELKKRVSQFNMKVPEDVQTLDYTSTHRLKFILQVRVSTAHVETDVNSCLCYEFIIPSLF